MQDIPSPAGALPPRPGSLPEAELSSAIFQAANSLLVVLDAAGRIVRFNPACERVSGYGAAEVEGRFFWEFLLLPDETDEVRQVFARLTAGDFPSEHENFWVTRGGALRRIAWSNTAIPGPQGTPGYVVGAGVDVTDQRAAEDALRRERDFARLVMDSLGQGLCVTDGAERIEYANPAFARLLGRPVPQLLGHAPGDFVLENGPEAGWPHGGLETDARELRLADAQGVAVDVLVTSVPRMGGGDYSGTISAVSNLTRRKEMERALRASEERYRDLFESANDLIQSVGPDGRLQYANRSWRALLGYTEEEVEGLSIFEVVSPSSREHCTAEFARLGAGESVGRIEAVFVARDGTEIEVEGTVSARHQDGRLLSTRGIFRDVTARNRAERALRESESRYRALVENASDIIFRTDPAGRFTYVNPAAVHTMGHPPERLVGTHYLELVQPQARAAVETFYARQFAERVPLTYHEFPVITADGREVWLGQSLRLECDGPRVMGTQAVARDVTARLTAERLKDEFAGIVSHELRTPLTSLRGSLGLLANGGLTPERSRRMIEVAVQNTDRLVRLINAFLDVERIESGRVAMEVGPVPAADLVSAAVEAIRGTAEGRSVEIWVDASPVAVLADRDRIIQVMVNLLSNAIKFSEPQSVVRITVEQRGSEVLFQVADTGRGIPAGKAEHIFERFAQVDSSDARQKGGAGLGLAICRGIVRQHGGRIWVASDVGRGSTFFFTLSAASHR